MRVGREITKAVDTNPKRESTLPTQAKLKGKSINQNKRRQGSQQKDEEKGNPKKEKKNG